MERRLTFEMLHGDIDGKMFIRGDIVDRRIAQSVLGSDEDLDACNQGKGIFQHKNAIDRHYIGGARLFQTFFRESNLLPLRYAGLCEWGKARNLHPQAAKKTFIISPYHAETRDQLLLHQCFAKALAKLTVRQYGDIPILPHLYFPSFLGDEGWERDFGIEAGHLIMQHCDSVLVGVISTRISDGMQSDIRYAVEELGIEPRYLFFTRQMAVDFIDGELGACDEGWKEWKGTEY